MIYRLSCFIIYCSLFISLPLSAQNQIRRLEYFIDNDPGVGKATPIITGFTPGGDISITVNNVSTAHLSEGIHHVYVRAMSYGADLTPVWSITQARSFIRTKIHVVPSVVRLEYFIDTDPGIGQASKIEITQGANIDQLVNISVDPSAAGTHTLYIRSMDRDGRWSITQTRSYQQFFVEVLPDITGLEYFIDVDPGFGKANNIVVTSPGDHVVQPFTVDISQIGSGVHRLYVRARNSDGKWSITQSNTFVKADISTGSNIEQLEYFIDTDPGFGKAAPVNINVPAQNITSSFQINVDTLGSGVHTLYIRSKNSMGRWGIVQTLEFIKIDAQTAFDVNYVEYFVDTDPGFGNAIPVPLNAPGQRSTQSFTVNTSQLSAGLHRLYVRARNKAGKWSITQNNMFVKAMSIGGDPMTALEWFIDTDPGFGKAHQVAISGSEVDKTFTADFENLEQGLHTLYVRARNAKGQWSVTQNETVFRLIAPETPDVVRLEYFITKQDDAGKTDPGFGKAINIPFVQGQYISQSFRVNLGGAEKGWYTLYVRAMDASGHWSITQQQHFLVCEGLSEAVTMEYFVDRDPGFGKGTQVPIPANGTLVININNGYSEGMHTMYIRSLNRKGDWSITQDVSFYSMVAETAGTIVALEYFIDTDPGFGQAVAVDVTSGVKVSRTFNVPLSASIKEGIHTFYVRARMNNGVWSMTSMKTFLKISIPDKADVRLLEWFIDKDKGFGTGNIVTLSQQSSGEQLIPVQLDDVSSGSHTLYIRSQNVLGKWSITQSIDLYVSELPENYSIADVTAIEYFVDSDPGIGKANRISIDTKGQNVQKKFAVSTASLNTGLHAFYVRAIDEKGKWSITHWRTFVKSAIPADYQLAEISRMEWFIDVDPGFGKANQLSVPTGINTGTSFDISLSGIDNGPHTLYVRAADANGKWTITQDISFFSTDIPLNVSKKVSYLEYFIDTDPGFGKGKNIPINNIGEDVYQQVFIPTDDIWSGIHTLYIRARDDQGFWTITQDINLVIVENPRLYGFPDIVALEYFLDDDPGFGNATMVNIPNRSVDVNHRFFIELDTVPEGAHTLYVRGMNSLGQWSHTQDISIFNTGIPRFEGIKSIVAFEYFVDKDPGFGNANYVATQTPDQSVRQRITVNVDTLKSGLHAVYVRALDNTGKWSHTQSSTFMRIEIKPIPSVVSMEWFIDIDPGFGKAKKVTISAATEINRLFNVTLPDHMNSGTHTLYVRALNGNGQWSITHSLDFEVIDITKQPGLAALEYFIDTDPGFGSATAMPIPYGDDHAVVTAYVPLTGFAPGIHTLYVRAKGMENEWSITQYATFNVVKVMRDRKMLGMEYFIDTDPGFGKANQVSITPSTTIDKTFNVDLTNKLPGLHTLYVRVRDENNEWSITQDVTFIRLEEIKVKNIVKAEYYIDEWKEFGAGIDIPITVGTSIMKTVQVNSSLLADGIHTIYVRVKDNLGSWSITQIQQFIKASKHHASHTVAMEWFIDSDPGFGLANPVTVTSSTVNIPINTTALLPGMHTLYIRAKNENGRWGITQDFSFIRLEENILRNIVAYEWFVDTDPGFGKSPNLTAVTPSSQISQTVPVDLSGTSDGIHTMYVRVRDNLGKWSISQRFTFLKTTQQTPANLVALEYFIDTDPGFGAGQQIGISGTEITHAFVFIDAANLTDGLHTLYIRALDDKNHWGITQDITFVRYEDTRQIADVAAIEWFIGDDENDDPGFGKVPASQRFTYATPQRVVIETFTVDISALNEGWHNFYVRAKNDTDAWSITQYQPFYVVKLNEVEALEYFIDTDKGFGQNTVVPVTPGKQVTAKINIPVSGLNEGMHTLFIRAKDNKGSWSITQYQNFVKVHSTRDYTELARLEWFVDTDPGFGSGRSIPLTGNNMNPAFVVETENLLDGGHTLYIRSLDKSGMWSITQDISFIKRSVGELLTSDLAYIEYFFDEDRGFGKGTMIPISGTQVIKSFTAQLPANTLPGLHTFYVRAQDTLGHWSQTQYNQFIKVEQRIIPNPVAIEYFIDQDPGFGKATRGSLTGAHVNVDNVSEGFHTLYVRALDDAGKWSITHNIGFMKVDIATISDVIAIEWFMDHDPGFGNAHAIPPFTVANKVTRTFAISLTAIDDGIHQLYIRAKDSKGNWSITQFRSFIKSTVRVRPNVVAVEYFIDTDPGFGKGKSVAISPSAKDYTASLTITADMLTSGSHTLYVRALDEFNKWSITQDISVQVVDMEETKISKVKALEYFFDRDPGFGMGHMIAISPTVEKASRKFLVPTSTLSDGLHILFIRAINEDNSWSVTHYNAFIKIPAIKGVPDIVRIEYFVDTDPGFGKGKPIEPSPDRNVDKSFDVDLTGIDLGQHVLYVRALNRDGKWAITHDIPFESKNIPEDDTSDRPVGGSITPALSTICQDATVVLRAQDYKTSIAAWDIRYLEEDGTVVSDWTTFNTVKNQNIITVSPRFSGRWQYRVRVFNGDRGPEYSKLAEIVVLPVAVGGMVTTNASEYVCSGKSFMLYLEEYKGEVVRWQQRNTTITTTWTDVLETNDVIAMTPPEGGKWEYRAEVAMSECSNAYSQILSVDVISSTTGGKVTPATLTSCPGKTFELIAKEYLGKIVRWQSSTDKGFTWKDIFVTEDILLNTLNDMGEVWYRAVIKAGNCDETYSEPSVVTVLSKIEDAGAISGPDIICVPSEHIEYSIPAMTVDGYEWTLPIGASIESGSNTNKISVYWPVTAQSGAITVKGTSLLCGVGKESVLPIEVRQRPATPNITGSSSVCVGQQVTYMATDVPGATYIWALPAGWTIISSDPDSRIISVMPGSISGTISVTVVANGCSSEIGTLDIMVVPSIDTGPIYRLPNWE